MVSNQNIEEIKEIIKKKMNLMDDFVLLRNGFLLKDLHFIKDNDFPIELSLFVQLKGGKGGFGSQLKAQGGRMANKKTTNMESCRDLSGRRLKTVNDAKK